MPNVRSATATLLVLVASVVLQGWLWGPNPECSPGPGDPASIAPAVALNSSRGALPPPAPADYDEVFSWLRSHGSDLDHVRVDSSHELRGLYVSRAVAAGHAVLRIPSGLSLSITTFSASAAARPHLHLLLALPDGDLLLDPFAVWYEAFVQGPASLWWSYLVALPHEYPLPLNYSAPVCTSLLVALPGLAQLTAAREAELQQVFPRMRLLLQLLPGGAAALRRHGHCRAWSSFLWAYSTAKTRTATLDTAAALSITSKASSSHDRDGSPGATHAAAATGQPWPVTALQRAAGVGWEWLDWVGAVVWTRFTHPPAAPASVPSLEQMEVVGALVPALDLANHGNGAEVTTQLQGRADYFALVAVRDLHPGDQVVISYNYQDDVQPQCNSRWLLEYGFVFTQPNQPPSRHCHAFRLKQAHALAAATAATAEEGEQDPAMDLAAAVAALGQQQAPALALLKVWGLPSEVWVELDGTGQVGSTVVEWLSVVAAAASQAGGPGGSTLQQPQQPPSLHEHPEHQHQARHMMRLLLREQHAQLQQHVSASRVAGCGKPPGDQHHLQCCHDLLVVAAGAVQAVDSSIRGLLQLEDPSI